MLAGGEEFVGVLLAVNLETMERPAEKAAAVRGMNHFLAPFFTISLLFHEIFHVFHGT